jgi:hypothetical protein
MFAAWSASAAMSWPGFGGGNLGGINADTRLVDTGVAVQRLWK